MVTAPTRRDRWLALGLLAVVLALIYALLVHPLWVAQMREVDSQVRLLQERHLRIRTQLLQAPQVAVGLQEAEKTLARRSGFLPEPSVELANAVLARRMEEAVQAASPDGRACAIGSRSPLAHEDADERFVRVSVRTQLRCGVPELVAVLHSLESGEPRLFVDNVNLLAERGANGGERSGGVEASFDLSGYLDHGMTATGATEANDAP